MNGAWVSDFVSFAFDCDLFFQPTGENGVTRAPIVIDMERDDSLTSKGLLVQIENKTQQVSASKHHSCKCIIVNKWHSYLYMKERMKENLNGWNKNVFMVNAHRLPRKNMEPNADARQMRANINESNNCQSLKQRVKKNPRMVTIIDDSNTIKKEKHNIQKCLVGI